MHPHVEDDIAALLKGTRAMHDHTARGWAVVHDGWLKDGLPPELSRPSAKRHGFELTVVDAFQCTLLLGWRSRDKRRVLFAMTALAPDQGALWGSWIELGEDFYRAVTAAPVCPWTCERYVP